ncbi:hypothetical protein [Nocardia transvalensis]|uniref:hypothetical protein n=1 Tax=Nocardia transvalensis TaxID=37333 RepID=UPI0018943F9A|nr:hypothetical protein [Nocardia transvalensis]MBF6327686.1 hypothetical protein [Nocardia transvalensis]
MRVTRHVLMSAVLAVAVAGTTTTARAQPDSATWYVDAAAPAGGIGSADAPFTTLTQAEAASRDGDTIVVQPASPAVPPLDGGIALKPGQRLVGGGPAVIGAPAGAALPRLTNTTAGHDGDAVVLAPGSEVRNLVIAGARRGGIYGVDAVGAVVSGNDVAGTNGSCVDGFHIGPFTIPPAIAVGATAPPTPALISLNNGWAAIMTDFSAATGTVRIEHNLVHDTACGDGIDLRAFGTSTITAELVGNDVRNINLGLAKLSVIAMGVQATDSARLTARLDGNSQTHIAAPDTSPLNAAADSEGVFVNPLGRAYLDVAITGNRFHNGDGNFSANGLEYVTTSGTPDSRVTVRDSSFDTVVGDIIENYNLSTDGAQQSLTLDNVQAHRSRFPGAPLSSVVPVNLGTCLVTTNFGRTGRTHLDVANSAFGDCSADGIGLVAFTPTGPEPSTAALTFDIRDTTVDGTAAHALNILNIGDTATLRGSVARSTFTGAADTLVHVSHRGGRIADATVDFGGGTLSSPGLNCFTTDRRHLDVSGITVAAHNNWWGRAEPPAGGAPAVDTTDPLPAAPRPGC